MFWLKYSLWDVEYRRNFTQQVDACIYLHREQDLCFREVRRIHIVFGELCRFMLYSSCFLRKLDHKQKRRQDLRWSYRRWNLKSSLITRGVVYSFWNQKWGKPIDKSRKHYYWKPMWCYRLLPLFTVWTSCNTLNKFLGTTVYGVDRCEKVGQEFIKFPI